MSSLYRRQLEQWVSGIEVEADSVLDVGGCQLPVDKRVKSWRVKEYLFMDNGAEYKPDIFHDLNHHYDPEPTENGVPYGGHFDVIFCLEVMEYIWNPLQAHETLHELLKPNGIAYISYPTLYPLHNPPGIDYLRYTYNAIEKLLAESGFQTWEITPRIASDGAKDLLQFWSREGMRPIKDSPALLDIGYMVKAYKEEL